MVNNANLTKKTFDYTPSVKIYGKEFIFAIEYDMDRIYFKKGRETYKVNTVYIKDDKYKNRLYLFDDDEIEYLLNKIKIINPKLRINIISLNRIKDLEKLIISFDDIPREKIHKA